MNEEPRMVKLIGKSAGHVPSLRCELYPVICLTTEEKARKKEKAWKRKKHGTSVAGSTLQYFTTLSHKRHDFRKKSIDHKMCVLIFFTRFVCNISRSKKNGEIYDHTCVLIFRVQWNLNCLDRFSKNTQILNFMKILSMEPEFSMRMDGQTWRN